MKIFFTILLVCSTFVTHAETIDLDRAIELALSTDPRIEEKVAFAKKAQAMLDEANQSGGVRVGLTSFLALTTGVKGGFYDGKQNTCSSNCEPRDDAYKLEDGLSAWAYLQATIIKPLTTFGLLENYQKAAEQNILVKNEDITLQKSDIRLDVIKAYNGYLTARDARYLMESSLKQVNAALDLVNEWLEEDKGTVKLSDQYALESGVALIERFAAQASGLESIALAGLSVLTGIPAEEIEVADKRLRPTEKPLDELEDYVADALANRPEFKQLKAGLAARRALVEAQKAENKPIVFVGVAGSLSISPDRYRLDNPHIYDPFNHAAASPMIGMNWDWEGGASDARVEQSKQELNALISKASFAQKGVPFQVAEQYYTVDSQFKEMNAMKRAAKSARRWMISAYTDFEAGLEEADKILTALQVYVLAYSDYLKIVNDYNNSVSKLYSVTGNYNDY